MTTASEHGRAELAAALHHAGYDHNAAVATLLSDTSDIYQVARKDGKTATIAKLGNGFAPAVAGWGYHHAGEDSSRPGYRDIPNAGYGADLADAIIGILNINEAWYPH